MSLRFEITTKLSYKNQTKIVCSWNSYKIMKNYVPVHMLNKPIMFQIWFLVTTLIYLILWTRVFII